ncbi:rod shape-determining protein MreD [Caldanaerobius fijiensis DSM 17918]|uniref:Rod shape-determining protein MreD n=1 Tax=Caldanaerobius fijiensis DSM 17918 TaxID=1121256 RepID=A0A1M4Y991_9THEO|nr:rod shape-determining protein MreD [Caldanaerobius fijiensis]SHF02417.1 rod shape-determining protein MreD [Caldanaerobius fijiensis DSM 17918]
MRNILIFILFLGAFIVQSTLFRFIGIYGVKPDLMLILLISFALLDGGLEGAILGLFIGFLQDLFFSPAIGMTMIPYFIIGLFAGYYNNKVFKEKTFTAFIFTFLYSLFFNLIMLFEIFIINHSVDLKTSIIHILIGTLYNCLIILFSYRYIVQLNNKKLMKKNTIFR